MLDWPYVEGLRIDEAMHPLTLLATGLYGQELPPQDGAPVRLVMPWKYGFKGIKSIVKITLTATRSRRRRWNKHAPDEYGFYANVNPHHDHPRWSQATEQRIGESGRRQDADVQRLRRPGREPLRGDGPRCPLLSVRRRAVRQAARRSSTASCRRRCSLWDALQHQLGVNEVNFAIRTTGLLGLVLLVLSLLVTPLRTAHRLERADRDAPQPRRARLRLHRRALR